MTAEIISEITTIAEDVTGLPTEELTTMAEEAVTNLWQKISGGATMGFSNALLVSVVGFAIVFAVLGFLAIFVYGMGKVFDSLQNKKKPKVEAGVAIGSDVSAPASPAGTPLPANQSIGDLTLINVTEEEAAAIMAITSAKTGIPLNRLKFNSIKYLEDKK